MRSAAETRSALVVFHDVVVCFSEHGLGTLSCDAACTLRTITGVHDEGLFRSLNVCAV